jgi:putative DNA primase/helicase
MQPPPSPVNQIQPQSTEVSTPSDRYLVHITGLNLYIGKGDLPVANPQDAAFWLDRAAADTTALHTGGVVMDMLPPPVPPPITNGLVPPEILGALQRGWEVFPVRWGSKDGFFNTTCKDGGAGYSWKKQATNDLAQVTEWARSFPGCNWGIRTGQTSGFFVIDLDGAAAVKWAQEKGLTPGYFVKTGNAAGDRYQMYFRQPEGLIVKTASDLMPGTDIKLDVRGDKNGYVIAPPSIHPSGLPYSLVASGELPEPQQWLLDLVVSTSPERAPVDSSDLPELSADVRAHGLNTLRSACRKYANVEAGSWNSELTKLTFLAGRLVARGVLTEEDAQSIVFEVPTVQTYLAEERRTVEGNWDRGIKDGLTHPWTSDLDMSPEEAFGTEPAPLPAGAQGAPGASSYLPEAMLAEMAAIAAANPDKDAAVKIMMQLGTQDSIAAAFATLYAGKLKFDHSRKKWHIWDGTRWREDDKKRVFDLAVTFCRDKNDAGKSSIGSASFAHGVEEIAASRPSMAVSGSEWDSDNYLLNTPAGTIDLRTGKMRAHDPADLITKCTVASPDTESDGAAFRKFMLEITEGDEELVKFHQVSLGACLSGAIEDHWLPFWVGEGRNGKNTLGDLVEEAMGDYARTIRTSTLMSKSHQGHPEELANLQGIRIAISSEVNDGDHWDESRIKQVTGDATISARFMYGSSFTYKRTHKHLVYGNHRPQLRSTDSAIKSRIKIVPFKVSFRGREDADLPRRLRGEMGYVLQWMIQGHQQWMAAGKRLPKCAAVDAESADYFASQSTPEMWLEECTEVVDPLSLVNSQWPRSSDLYRSYAEWKKSRGEPAQSQTRWAETMQKKFEKVKSVAGVHYKGLRILPPQWATGPFPPPPQGVSN